MWLGLRRVAWEHPDTPTPHLVTLEAVRDVPIAPRETGWALYVYLDIRPTLHVWAPGNALTPTQDAECRYQLRAVFAPPEHVPTEWLDDKEAHE